MLGTYLLCSPLTHSPTNVVTLFCSTRYPESLQDADRLPPMLLLRLIHLFGAVLAGGKVCWLVSCGPRGGPLGTLLLGEPTAIFPHP